MLLVFVSVFLIRVFMPLNASSYRAAEIPTDNSFYEASFKIPLNEIISHNFNGMFNNK